MWRLTILSDAPAWSCCVEDPGPQPPTKLPTHRYGLLECINHNLLQPFPVLYEKPDALVAHVSVGLGICWWAGSGGCDVHTSGITWREAACRGARDWKATGPALLPCEPSRHLVE